MLKSKPNAVSIEPHRVGLSLLQRQRNTDPVMESSYHFIKDTCMLRSVEEFVVETSTLSKSHMMSDVPCLRSRTFAPSNPPPIDS